jgi:hypothetical protein
MSAEERMRSFSRFAMNAGLAHTAADIHVNTGLSFLNSFGATASEGLSRLLNSFPPALQPVAAGEMAIPVPVGVEVVSWTPVAVGDSAAGFIKATHGGSLALRSFTPEANNGFGVRETFKVANIHEFFKMPFGIKLKSKCQPMKQSYQGQRMYKVTENIPGTPLKKGDIFYLDAQHKNHLEVFTEQGKSRTVLNLDGSINVDKTRSAKHRRIKF